MPATVYRRAVCIAIRLIMTGLLFSNDNRFCLSSDCRHKLIRHEVDNTYSGKYSKKRSLCDIKYHGVSKQRVQWPQRTFQESMTGRLFIEDILLPHVCLFRGVVCEKFRFMAITHNVITDSLYKIVLMPKISLAQTGQHLFLAWIPLKIHGMP